MSRDDVGNGTRCARPFFASSAGICQMSAVRSKSPTASPCSSPQRCPRRSRRRSTSAAAPPDATSPASSVRISSSVQIPPRGVSLNCLIMRDAGCASMRAPLRARVNSPPDYRLHPVDADRQPTGRNAVQEPRGRASASRPEPAARPTPAWMLLVHLPHAPSARSASWPFGKVT